ncbi:uncharacterized protein NPIL_25391 [Nephila pilipes]|uniref:Uncharacterized protein n=1 Tax=Nephila pilipes TaxID=299642 RepID=A0A8X6UKN2_NEPPI|nr:uncharacterized protein NPIL_25391 [Nephila pilipes]
MNQLRLVLIIGCLGGFLYQTVSFLFYYWTHAVVVDIQITAPEEFPIPAITFCNDNGINPRSFCDNGASCILAFLIKQLFNCTMGPFICLMLRLGFPRDYKVIAFSEFLKKNSLSPSDLKQLKKPVKDFFSCRIISVVGQRSCNTDDILIGSYYSDSNFFGVCYTINSRWLRPNKTIEKIRRSDKIEIEFYVNMTDRNKNVSEDTIVMPKYNYPSSLAIQLGLHNNDASLSPHRNGVELLGGKRYQITLKQMAVEECKYNHSLEKYGCVPFSVDYPHNDTICKMNDYLNMSQITIQCEGLLKRFNQPCDFTSYKINLEEKPLFIEKTLVIPNTSLIENLYLKQKGHSCFDSAIFKRR